MTDEQILELAKTCAIFETDSYHWECWEQQLLKFARAMYSKGRLEGYAECYNYATHKLNSLN